VLCQVLHGDVWNHGHYIKKRLSKEGSEWTIRNLNNAVMGFWTVQRGLIRQFFTHNTYNLICRQVFNPNMQADLPWQTFTHKCQIELPNRQIELPNCQIEFILPNWIANRIAELSNWIRFAKRIAEPNCRTELPNWIAELNCRTELPNWNAELNCQTELPKLNCRNWIANWIAETELNCSAKWIAKLNCHAKWICRT
jgi:hypothetical protein